MQPDHVLVRVRCNTRRQEVTLCVRVNRGVPDQLRCTPSGGVGGGGASHSVASVQPCCKAIDFHVELTSSFAAAGRHHVKAGAVVVTC